MIIHRHSNDRHSNEFVSFISQWPASADRYIDFTLCQLMSDHRLLANTI